MQAEHQLYGQINRGKREMRELALTAFSALERAELIDILDLLHTLVLRRPPADLMDVVLVDGVWEWRFKPMIELMLRHMSDTAANIGRPIDSRREDLRGVLEMLGF